MSRVIEIVKAHLVAGGFDGLVQTDAECGCELSDLVPCCGDFGACEPAYRGVQPADSLLDGDWAMYRTKEAAEASIATAQQEPKP
jgi:hypothetical protein